MKTKPCNLRELKTDRKIDMIDLIYLIIIYQCILKKKSNCILYAFVYVRVSTHIRLYPSIHIIYSKKSSTYLCKYFVRTYQTELVECDFCGFFPRKIGFGSEIT